MDTSSIGVPKTRKRSWIKCAYCGVYKEDEPSLRFFRFPRDKERCQMWVSACNKRHISLKSPETLYRSNRLCSKHFEDSCYSSLHRHNLHSSAVPTIFKDRDVTGGKSDNSASIPFIETEEERAKIKKRCSDILFICERMKIPLIDDGDDEQPEFLGLQDVLPVPPLNAYLPEDSRIERSKLFFQMITNVRIVYAEVMAMDPTNKFHQMNILCADFEVKIDDFKLRAMLRKNELGNHPDRGTLVRAYIDTCILQSRQLILTLDRRKLPEESRDQKLGVIKYEELPGHYRMMKELDAKQLPKYLKQIDMLMPDDLEKLMKSLNLDVKWSSWSSLHLSKAVKPEEMASSIRQQQIEFHSREHLNKGMDFYSKQQFDEASIEFKKVLDLDPKNVKALSSLGALYRAQKKYEQAIETFETALALDEGNENNKQFLIKALQEYVENEEETNEIEKLRYTKRILELNGKTRKNLLLEKYLGAQITLIDGMYWLSEWRKEDEKEAEAEAPESAVGNSENSGSDMELDSEEDIRTINMEENISAEKVSFTLKKPEEVAAKVIGKNPLVDYEGDSDDEDVGDDSNKPGGEEISVEEISDSSLDRHSSSSRHATRAKDAKKDKEHRERSKHHRRIHSSRSSESRRHHHHHRHVHKSRRHRERRSPSPQRSHLRSSSSNSSKQHHKEEYRGDRRKRDSIDCGSTTSSSKPDDIPTRYRDPDVTSLSKSSRSERSSHRYNEEREDTVSHSRTSRYRTDESDYRLEERDVHPKSLRLVESHEDDIPVSRAAERLRDLDLAKASKPSHSELDASDLRASSSERISRRHWDEDANVSRRPAERYRDPVHAEPLKSHSPSGSRASGSDGEDKGDDLNVPKAFKKGKSAYMDWDKPDKRPREEDPFRPQAVVPCASYPSFSKTPAVSIMNEIVDMIQEVKKKGK